MNPPLSDCPQEFKVLIGLDWGDQQHAYCLRQPDGQIQTGTLQQTPEALHQWLEQLQERFPNTSMALGIETTKGPLINGLLGQEFLTIFPIHPATSAHYRRAFTPSGAKDDLPDSRVLLEILIHHRDKLRALFIEDPATRKLAGLVEARRKAVDRRTRLSNALKCRLKSYYPQALELAGEDLFSPLAMDLLSRWPELLSLQRAKPAILRKFFYLHNLRRPEHIQKRLDRIASARSLTTDEAIVTVAVAEVRALVEQLRVLQKHIAIFESEIAKSFKNHPEAELFRELPGAGAVLAPRLLVAFGTDRTRYPDASSLQKYSGIAPVREKSGAREWIHWRWNAPKFLRQSFHEWAGQTVIRSPWAKEFYRRQKQGGKGHHAILRALAFKWQRILWKCWSTHQAYREEIYVAALQRRCRQVT
jgi:transposase